MPVQDDTRKAVSVLNDEQLEAVQSAVREASRLVEAEDMLLTWVARHGFIVFPVSFQTPVQTSEGKCWPDDCSVFENYSDALIAVLNEIVKQAASHD